MADYYDENEEIPSVMEWIENFVSELDYEDDIEHEFTWEAEGFGSGKGSINGSYFIAGDALLCSRTFDTDYMAMTVANEISEAFEEEGIEIAPEDIEVNL